MAASSSLIVRFVGSLIPFLSQMAVLGFLLLFGCSKKARSTKKVDLVRASEAETISTGKKSNDSVEKPQASGTIEKKIPALGAPDNEPILKPKVIPLDEKGKRIAAGERRKRNDYPTMVDVNSDWGDDDKPATKEKSAPKDAPKDATNDKPATKEKSAPKDAPKDAANDKPATKEKSAPKEEKLVEKDKPVEKQSKEKSAPKQEKVVENDKPVEKPSEDKLQPSTDQVKKVASPAKPVECEKELVLKQSPVKKKDALPVASPVIKPVAIVMKPIVAIPLIAVPKKPEVNVNKAPQEVSAKEMATQAESIRASEEKSSKHEPSDEKDNAKPDDAKQPASSDGE